MRTNYLLYALGIVIKYVGIVLLVPLLVAIYYKDFYSAIAFLCTGTLSIVLGICLKKIATLKTNISNLNDIKKSEALFIVAASWVIFGILAAIPFLFYGFSIEDSIFESVSGITTTGATILTHFNYPKTMFFWRSFIQWLGGMGIIVLFVAVLPQFAVAGRQMFFAEAPGPVEEKLSPRIRNTASALWGIYLGLTILAAILLIWAGMSKFDAVCNAMSTLSAGGFSPNAKSTLGYNSNLITWILTIFMFFAGANFLLQLRALKQKNPFTIFKNEEFRTYTYILIILSCLVALTLYFNSDYKLFDAITASIYQVVSISTSTGSVSSDYVQWDFSSKLILFIAMFTGSCAGSAGGGIKITRWILVFKSMKSELFRILHPNAVINIKIDNTIIQPEVIRQIIVFVFFYFFIFLITSFTVTLIEQNAIIGFSGAITTLGDCGPGFGTTIGPIGNYSSLHLSSKIIFTANMLIGRLELIPFLVFLERDFWTFKQI